MSDAGEYDAISELAAQQIYAYQQAAQQVLRYFEQKVRSVSDCAIKVYSERDVLLHVKARTQIGQLQMLLWENQTSYYLSGLRYGSQPDKLSLQATAPIEKQHQRQLQSELDALVTQYLS